MSISSGWHLRGCARRIATKIGDDAESEDFWKELGISLANLRTDYINVSQFHNPAFCPNQGDGSGLLSHARGKGAGKIRHIGITNHRLKVAEEAIASGTLRDAAVPVCYLATEEDKRLVALCKERTWDSSQ